MPVGAKILFQVLAVLIVVISSLPLLGMGIMAMSSEGRDKIRQRYKTSKEIYSQVLTLLVVVAVGSVVAVIAWSAAVGTLPNDPFSALSGLPTQIEELQNAVDSLQVKVDNVVTQTVTNTNSISSAVSSSSSSPAMTTELSMLEKRVGVIEQAVLDNPARSLELTLLSRDLDNLQAAYKTDLDEIRQEVQRIYSFNQWFLGVIVTLALGMLGLALSNFLKR